jgi:hypothetical protein
VGSNPHPVHFFYYEEITVLDQACSRQLSDKTSNSATKFRILEDPRMCSDFIIQKSSYASYPYIMKLKREGATIKEYYEYVEH